MYIGQWNRSFKARCLPSVKNYLSVTPEPAFNNEAVYHVTKIRLKILFSLLYYTLLIDFNLQKFCSVKSSSKNISSTCIPPLTKCM